MSTNQFNFSDGVKVGDVNIAGELFCGEILPNLSAPLGDVNLKDIHKDTKAISGSCEVKLEMKHAQNKALTEAF